MLEVDSTIESTFNCSLLFSLTPIVSQVVTHTSLPKGCPLLTYSPMRVYNYTIASHGNFIWICLHLLDPLAAQQQWIPNNIRWVMLWTEYCVPSNLYTKDHPTVWLYLEIGPLKNNSR